MWQFVNCRAHRLSREHLPSRQGGHVMHICKPETVTGHSPAATASGSDLTPAMPASSDAAAQPPSVLTRLASCTSGLSSPASHNVQRLLLITKAKRVLAADVHLHPEGTSDTGMRCQSRQALLQLVCWVPQMRHRQQAAHPPPPSCRRPCPLGHRPARRHVPAMPV